jgi:hypothetical protein
MSKLFSRTFVVRAFKKAWLEHWTSRWLGKEIMETDSTHLRLVERSGRRVNLVFPEGSDSGNEISIPVEILEKGSKVWGNSAIDYALDSETIGVSGGFNEDWERKASFRNRALVTRDGDNLKIDLPDNVKSFYKLDNKQIDVRIESSNIVIIITSSKIVESKKKD